MQSNVFSSTFMCSSPVRGFGAGPTEREQRKPFTAWDAAPSDGCSHYGPEHLFESLAQ